MNIRKFMGVYIWETLGWLLCEASFRINAWIDSKSGFPWTVIYKGVSWPLYHIGCWAYGQRTVANRE